MTIAASNSTPAGAQESAGHPRRWWILGVVSFAAFTLFADNTIVNTALPSIARDLDASTSQLQWIVDSYVLMLAGLLLVGGAVGDLFGRRRWFGVGLGIFGLGATVAALSTSSEQLIIGRALQGMGGALIMPATLSIITNVFPAHERAKAIGIWTGVTGLAMGFGPASWRLCRRCHGLADGLLAPHSCRRPHAGRACSHPRITRRPDSQPRYSRRRLRHRGSDRARARHHRRWRSGLDVHRRARLLHGVRRRRHRLRRHRTAHRKSHAAAALLQAAPVHRRGRHHRPRLLQRGGDILLPHAVLPVRPGPDRV
ncbi:MAG: MFS transporter [Thermoflexaceae bacterium]|nr:MFS transporter [Thermoflexaceae bacterium]